ncbi:hypothetical protein ACFLQV_04140 [Calditrichota bacterium]
MHALTSSIRKLSLVAVLLLAFVFAGCTSDSPTAPDPSIDNMGQGSYKNSVKSIARESEGSARSLNNTPTELMIWQSNVSNEKVSVSLRWEDNSRDESNFKIYRHRRGSEVWLLIGSTETNRTRFDDSNVRAGMHYEYAVQACGNGWYSAYSEPVSIQLAKTVHIVAKPNW